MVELAIGVAAFLFLCWVAVQGFALIWSLIQVMAENNVLWIFVLVVALLLLRIFI